MKMMSEMAFGGAKVVHPRSVYVAIAKNIPVYIYNTFNRSFKGTKVTSEEIKDVKGIVSSDRNMLFHIENPNMLEEVGFIAKVTDIVKQFDISIDVCSTSETSFTFSIDERDFDSKLQKALSKIARVKVIRGIAKISMIGHGITDSANVFEETFRLFYNKKVPIRCVSVGTSQRNITLMVDQQFKDQILNDLHHQWILKKWM
jgi:aspartate kinase